MEVIHFIVVLLVFGATCILGQGGGADPATVCGAVTPKTLNNGCSFRCGGTRTYSRQDGMECGTGNECSYGGCYPKACIEECKSHMTSQLTYIAVRNKRTRAFCHDIDHIMNVYNFQLNGTVDCGMYNNYGSGRNDGGSGGSSNDGRGNRGGRGNGGGSDDGGDSGGRNGRGSDPAIVCGVVTPKTLNNGCTFSCGNTNKKYSRPDGTECGTGNVCISGGCFPNACIEQCKSNMKNPLTYITVKEIRKRVLCHDKSRVMAVYNFPLNGKVDCGKYNTYGNTRTNFGTGSDGGGGGSDGGSDGGGGGSDGGSDSGTSGGGKRNRTRGGGGGTGGGIGDANKAPLELMSGMDPYGVCFDKYKTYFPQPVAVQIKNGGCFSQCYQGFFKKQRYYVANGNPCGTGMTCLNGSCVTDSCVSKCQEAGSQLIAIKQNPNQVGADCIYQNTKATKGIQLAAGEKCSNDNDGSQTQYLYLTKQAQAAMTLINPVEFCLKNDPTTNPLNIKITNQQCRFKCKNTLKYQPNGIKCGAQTANDLVCFNGRCTKQFCIDECRRVMKVAYPLDRVWQVADRLLCYDFKARRIIPNSVIRINQTQPVTCDVK